MKVRQGFVSNSSSSSFVIPKHLLTEEQICDLKAFCSGPVGIYYDSWDVSEDDYNVHGWTSMENNDSSDPKGIREWMRKAGFPMHAILWEGE